MEMSFMNWISLSLLYNLLLTNSSPSSRRAFCVRTLGFIAIDRVNEYHVLDESRDRHEKVDEDRDEIVNNLNIT